MRVVVLAVLVAAPVSAQPVLFPAGTAAPGAAHWRVSAGGGLTADAHSAVVAASAERSWRGRLALGGRVWATAGSGFVDDGPSLRGGGGEAFVSAGTRDRWLDLRASAGLGLASLDYGPGGPGCDPAFDPCQGGSQGFTGTRPYAFAGLGMDWFLLPGVGLGAEVRAALMEGPATVSAAEVGVRVRIAR